MESGVPDDGLKWFGEGFDGFPRRLPDDCVEYAIYLINPKSDPVINVRSRLNAIRKAAQELKRKYLKDYIWQRDDFELNVFPKIDLADPSTLEKASSRSSIAPHLRGRTNFGDSVADEWLIVYLLHELSEQFSDAWIRVYDTDGEFLLIEAANALPKWLNPEIADNRVWINNGHLNIIPLSEGNGSRNLDLHQALSALSDSPAGSLIEPATEKEAFHRIREYPSSISSSLHHAIITIPRRLAYVLHHYPAYISPAIEAFYLRDPISLKPLSTKDIATLSFAPEDFVTVSVKFTKVGYAQLRSQIFDPPPAWTGIIPRMQDEKVAMGMKLTCGFEMMVADTQNQNNRSVREVKLLLDDLVGNDDELPTDAEIDSWPKVQDDEKWLDIDYNDFEKELSGQPSNRQQDPAKNGAFGDKSAQENLRKLVSRFQDFVEDDDAGAEGVDDLDDDDIESSDSPISSADEEQSEIDEAEFEMAMKQTMSMPESQIEQSGLLTEARKLALQDAEDGSDIDEDEEMRKVMDLMEKELKGHGALDLGGKGKGKAQDSKIQNGSKTQVKPFFGPERPPHMKSAALTKNVEHDDDENAEDIGPGDGELSSDDEEFNDVDLGLARNMLEAFKGQAGMSGPAGNLMRSMGINMPRDEGDGKDK